MDITKNKKLISLILAGFFAVLLLLSAGYFANKYFGLFRQKIKISNPFSSKVSQNIQTGSKSEDGYLLIPAQIITAPVVRFTVDVGPKQIESVTARLKFKPGPKEIKLGIRGSENDQFVYQSLYQKLLQDSDWSQIDNSGSILYQKNKNYDSLAKLVAEPPDKSKIASYFVDKSVLIQGNPEDSSDLKQAKPISVKTGLRGTHTFIVRVDSVPFTFKISKQDINAYEGEDKFSVSIVRDGRLIEKKLIPDDGFTGRENLKKEPQSAEFTFDQLDPGIYEIVAKSESYGDDVGITSIETNQSKMVITNKVFPLYGKPVVLYTNSSPVTIRAVHRGSVQTVKLDDSISLELENASKNYVFDLEKLVPDKKVGELYKLEIPKTDVIVDSAGYFSFSSEQYFSPEVIKTTDLNTVTSLDEIDYILTSVQKAKKEDDWLVSEITFDGKNIEMDDNQKLYFALEIPDLQKDNSGLEIKSFEVEVSIPGIFADKSSQANPEKPTLLTRIGAIPGQIGSFFGGKYQSLKAFIGNTYNRLFHKNQPPTDTNAPAAQPSASPTSENVKSVTIKVLNGGAASGAAKKYADLIEAAGYSNVETGNAEASASGALITYPTPSEEAAKKIEDILKAEYTLIQKTVDNQKKEITVTIGKK